MKFINLSTSYQEITTEEEAVKMFCTPDGQFLGSCSTNYYINLVEDNNLVADDTQDKVMVQDEDVVKHEPKNTFSREASQNENGIDWLNNSTNMFRDEISQKPFAPSNTPSSDEAPASSNNATSLTSGINTPVMSNSVAIILHAVVRNLFPYHTHPRSVGERYIPMPQMLPNKLRRNCSDFIAGVRHAVGFGRPLRCATRLEVRSRTERDGGCIHMRHTTKPMHFLYLLLKPGKRRSEFCRRFLFGGGYDTSGTKVVSFDYHPEQYSEEYVRLCFRYTTQRVVASGHYLRFFMYDMETNTTIDGYFRFSTRMMRDCVYECSSLATV